MNDSKEPNAEDLFAAEPSKPIDMFPILLELVRGKWTILLSGLVCAVLAFLFLLRVHPTYKATTEIVPPAFNRSLTGASALAQAGGGSEISGLAAMSSPLMAKPQSDEFIAIMQAWPIQLAVAKQFHLEQVFHTRSEEDAATRFALMVTLTATKEGLITVDVVDTNPQRAADIANGYIDQTRQFLRNLSLSEIEQRREFFEAQLAKTKDDLAQAEINFEKLQQTSGMISMDTQAKTLLETAATLRAQVTAKEVQLESLRSYSTESNAQVQIAESELSALRGQLAEVESHGQGGLTGKGISTMPESEVAFVRATRELKYQESLYEQLMKQFEASRLDEARDAPIIQVIEPARTPLRKFGPRRLRDIRIAFGVGLLLGMVIVFLRRWMRNFSPETRTKLQELKSAAVGSKTQG